MLRLNRTQNSKRYDTNHIENRADESGLSYESIFSKITLEIHSSLDAVGLTAAFSNKLTSYGISANVVAGYYHDHI